MATDVTMPRLSDSMEEGTVLKWLVEKGGEVKRGEPLVEIETDKANMTYEADAEGVLVEIVAEEGDTVALGEVIARLGEPGEEPASSEDGKGEAGGEAEADEAAEREAGAGAPEPDEEEAEAPEPEEREGATATAEAPARGTEGGDGAGDGRVKASPVARRMARELGVELEGIEGTGPGGRIVKADVEAAAEGDGAEAPPAEAEPAEAPEREEAPAEKAEVGAKGAVDEHELSRLQQTVSRRMAESKATAPDFAISLDVDMTGCMELRDRLKEVADPAPSYNDMVVKAAAKALREHPRVNGAYRDGRWELYSNVNVGVAVASEEALIVPTIFEADRKSLGEISRQARELIGKVRDQKITPPEVSSGTFTVSNLGMYGIERFSAIINPPQAALLAVGALKRRPVVDEDSGRIVARHTMTLTLVCDHRILYGADAAQFLARVRELLEQPLSLTL
jgi:pyruvate dehydrogenase E2 component (dihydrolipoamide acetyltransferase)